MLRRLVLAPLVLVLVAASPTVASAAEEEPRLPRTDAPWDYQIGGARAVPAGVELVVRDRREAPGGDYPVCYVNGFQTQPDERAFWRKRPGLVLRDRRGRAVVDSSWGEQLLDLRTRGKRARLTGIVDRWMARCARDGFVAVEIDNLDSWTRSRGLMKRRHAAAYARRLTAAAHARGLAVAQKNTFSLLHKDLGFDFAIVEECARWDECGRFAAAYDQRVYVVEYRAKQYRRACRQVGDLVAVTFRDRDVTPQGPFRSC